jgi:Zn-dependent protease with chaperone function
MSACITSTRGLLRHYLRDNNAGLRMWQQSSRSRRRWVWQHSSQNQPHLHPHHVDSHWYSRIVVFRQKPILQRIGYIVRLVRIPIVAAGIFSLGYHQGVIESQRQPQYFQKELMDAMLLDCCPDGNVQVEILSELDVQGWGAANKIATSRNHQVASVATKIIQQAKLHIRHELEKAEADARASLLLLESSTTKGGNNKTLSEAEMVKRIAKSKQVSKWREAQWRVIGSDLDTEPWRFVFVNGPGPNAWVAELLPKRIFITTSLLDFADTIDEVAFVLGHEMSHFVHGHVSLSNELSKNLKTAEILLLTMDPTEGMLAFGVIAILDMIRRSIEASYSREHEHEADELGLILVNACGEYDLEAGPKFMYRLYQNEDKSLVIPLLDTHPPSLERARNLYKDAKELLQSGRDDQPKGSS